MFCLWQRKGFFWGGAKGRCFFSFIKQRGKKNRARMGAEVLFSQGRGHEKESLLLNASDNVEILDSPPAKGS